MFNSKETWMRFWRRLCGFGLVLLVVAVLAYLNLRWYQGNSDSNSQIYQWLVNPDDNLELSTAALSHCPNALFIIPSEGFIGLLWRDTATPYNSLRRHTGIDIFGRGDTGTVPVYAVYDEYLSRLDNWVSTVIIRHENPLVAGRTIWTYYTHALMA